MGYKFIEGKAYKVEEIDIDDIKIEVEQVLAVLSEQKTKIASINEAKETCMAQFDKQIATYNEQIASLTLAIDKAKEKKEACQAPFVAQVEECTAKIEKAKATLDDKKDVIEALLPTDFQALEL